MSLDLNMQKPWALDPTQPVAAQLRVILRHRIIYNELQPMTRLSEPDLAQFYNVSRQPVREAFITLEHEGLVEIRPKRGTFVKQIDLEAVLNGRFVREAVEAAIVRQLAAKPDPLLIEELKHQLAEQRAVDENDPAAFIALDERFHKTLARAAKLEKSWLYLEPIKAQMDRVRFISSVEFPSERLIEQHENIVERIAAADVPGAEKALCTHLNEIRLSLPQLRNLYPDYFENGDTASNATPPQED